MTCACAHCERDRADLAAVEVRYAAARERFIAGQEPGYWDALDAMRDEQDARTQLLGQLADHERAASRRLRRVGTCGCLRSYCAGVPSECSVAAADAAEGDDR